jgi:hypothetical protein
MKGNKDPFEGKRLGTFSGFRPDQEGKGSFFVLKESLEGSSTSIHIHSYEIRRKRIDINACKLFPLIFHH